MRELCNTKNSWRALPVFYQADFRARAAPLFSVRHRAFFIWPCAARGATALDLSPRLRDARSAVFFKEYFFSRSDPSMCDRPRRRPAETPLLASRVGRSD